MSNKARLGLIGAVIVAAVALFVVLRSGGDDDSPTTTTTQAGEEAKAEKPSKPQKPDVPVIRVKDAQPVGGAQDISVTKGDPVRFEVVSDTAGDVHLHGYELEKPVKAGGTASFDIPSTLDGKFEIELHVGGSETNSVEIGELTVNP